jgi:hypothetical protein
MNRFAVEQQMSDFHGLDIDSRTRHRKLLDRKRSVFETHQPRDLTNLPCYFTAQVADKDHLPDDSAKRARLCGAGGKWSIGCDKACGATLVCLPFLRLLEKDLTIHFPAGRLKLASSGQDP